MVTQNCGGWTRWFMIYVKMVNDEISTKRGAGNKSKYWKVSEAGCSIFDGIWKFRSEICNDNWLSVYPSPTQPSFVYAVSTLPINCCCFFFLFSNSLRSSRDCYAPGTSLAAGPGGIFKSVEAVSCSQSSCSSAPAKTLPYPLPHANYNNKDSTRRLNPPATHAIFIVKLSKVLTLYLFP